MDNVTEVVALLRQQAALEQQLMNTEAPAVAAEGTLATTRRRLVAYPQALAAVLHTARALRRSPDTISVRDVTAFGGSNYACLLAMRVAFRHFLLDSEGTPYRLPTAALDRMLRDPRPPTASRDLPANEFVVLKLPSS